ncbi:MAG TPA: hypothetical protein VFV96_09320 [Verrucomicrobiae bacterium]|nr:hypothetical protein [Verrucomicrobiae bacterium]
MTRLILISAILVSLVAGCGTRFGGGSSASYGNADHETATEVLTQRDPTGQLLFVIAWTAEHGGGSTSFSDRNQLTSIHGHEVHPSFDRRAVYALQADGSLRQVALSDEQVATLFREMEQPGFHTSHSDLWQKAVAPHLIRVEPTNGT